jgi:hypothetical protein
MTNLKSTIVAKINCGSNFITYYMMYDIKLSINYDYSLIIITLLLLSVIVLPLPSSSKNPVTVVPLL